MTIDPRVQLCFARRCDDPTLWLEMEHPVDARPDALLADLAALGWTVDPYAAPEFEARDEQFTPLGYLVREIVIAGPVGSSLFGGWTEQEAEQRLADAREVLAAHGRADVEIWTKSLADMS